MPIYEFFCNACQAKVSIFVRSMSSPVAGVCDRCGSTDLQRLISKVTVLRAPIDPSKIDKFQMLEGLDQNDPRSVARWARNLHEQFGEEMPEEFTETMERIERGEGGFDELIEGPGHGHDDDDGGLDDF